MNTVQRCRIRGLLAGFEDGYRERLQLLGYAATSVECKVHDASRLSRWMGASGLTCSDLDPGRLSEFTATLHRSGQWMPTPARMGTFVDFLRAEGVLLPAPVVVEDPLGDLIASYQTWMVGQRGLAPRTVGRYVATARVFFGERVSESVGVRAALESLTAESVTGFLLGETERGLAVGSLHGRVAEIRSLLRFLYSTGLIERDLARAIPPVAGWKAVAVPPRMGEDRISRLLASCDQSTPIGLRDRAMLLLMARLGLRAAEVAALRLEDLRWRTGEMTVRGKSRRTDVMPIPADVGAALARYLRDARPGTELRQVFLTAIAPHRPLWPTAVSQTVWRQCNRAGISPPIRAHALRHGLATGLLDRGVRLVEIGQVLRQSDLATTAGYAKVDYRSLRELAPQWPGADR